MDAYLEGSQPERLREEVETHLAKCAECTRIHSLLTLTKFVIEEEKRFRPEPFLFTRIMAQIEKAEQKENETQFIPAWRRIVSPVLVSFSFIAAIFIGITAGNLALQSPSENKMPVELTYFDDAAMESVEAFSYN